MDIYIYISTYTYVYVDRKREGERERETETGRGWGEGMTGRSEPKTTQIYRFGAGPFKPISLELQGGFRGRRLLQQLRQRAPRSREVGLPAHQVGNSGPDLRPQRLCGLILMAIGLLGSVARFFSGFGKLCDCSVRFYPFR